MKRTHVIRFINLSSAKKQRGQSSVFAIVFLGVVLLGLVFIYKAGVLTSEKMKLQNAADAIAYSVATIEARDLNFAAYTNRAMVSNEVAIGQMVGLASWGQHWESLGFYTDAFCASRIEPVAAIANATVIAAGVGAALNSLCGGIRAGAAIMKSTGKTAQGVLDPLATGVITALDITNVILGAAQTMFHVGSVAYTLKLLDSAELLKAHDVEDARLSPYGLVALLAHLDSYGALETISQFKNLGSPVAFTRTYWPDKTFNALAKPEDDEDGFKVFAAVTNLSGDEFTKNRGWSYEFPAPLSIHDGNYNPVSIISILNTVLSAAGLPTLPDPLFPTISIGGGVAIEPRLTLDIYSLLNIVRLGGSELRFVGNEAIGSEFNWSSADTTSQNFEFTFDFEGGLFLTYPDICIFLPVRVFGACVSTHDFFGSEFAIPPALAINAELLNNQVSFNIGSLNTGGLVGTLMDFFGSVVPLPSMPSVDFPASNPWSAGATQVGAELKESDFNNLTNLNAYGGAPGGTPPLAARLNPAALSASAGPMAENAWHKGSPLPGYLPVTSKPITQFALANSFRSGAGALTSAVPVVSKSMTCETLPGSKTLCGSSKNTPYSGLKMYTGTQKIPDPFNFEGQNAIISLQLDHQDLFSATAPKPVGQLELEPTQKLDNVSVLSKGQVYFSRPNDISYYVRGDSINGKPPLETGNAFSPFWQAKLAPLSYADRAVANLQVSNADLVKGSAMQAFRTVTWDIVNWIP